MTKNKFARDMKLVMKNLAESSSPEIMSELDIIKERLIELNKRRLVKINHSVMQLICAKHLIEMNYKVYVEYSLLGGQLMADIFALKEREPELVHDIEDSLICERLGISKDLEALVVEVETGYVPPSAALSPVHYRGTRLAAKIARYCRYSHRFALSTPNYHILQIPRVLLKPPEEREEDQLQTLKRECDAFYQSPPIQYEALALSEVDSIIIIDIDNMNCTDLTPIRYLDSITQAEGIIFE